MILILLGYMGSGKSTYGKLLSEKIQREFIDLDDYIESKEQMSILKIFESKGEIYFRKKENYYLKSLIQERENVVIGLGGGTPCYSNNMELIKKLPNVTSVFINTSLDLLTERLFIDKLNRPLVKSIDSKLDLKEFIAKHLFERNQFYQQADFTIKVTDNNINETVDNLKHVYDNVTL